MPTGPLRLLRWAPPGPASLDVALSRALLEAVAAGREPPTLRLYWPRRDALAFSAFDRARPGFPAALAAARGAGCDAALRLAGGRAALFPRSGLCFAWAVPSEAPRNGICARYAAAADWICGALGRLGVDARVGAVPGEYCPGDFSVNAGCRVKLAGIGQRVVRRAAHVGGVIAAGDAEQIRRILAPVYRALGYGWDGAAVGSVEGERPGCSRTAIEAAFVAALADRCELRETAELDPALYRRAHELEAQHRL